MNNLRNIVLAFCVFCFSVFVSNAKATYVGGVINMKNGKKIECQINESTFFAYNIEYRLSSTSPVEIVKQENIKSIVIPDGEGNVAYLENVLYLKSKDFLKGDYSDTRSEMMNVREYGSVSLFCKSITTYQNGKLLCNDLKYYGRKEGTDYAVYLGWVQTQLKPFQDEYYTKTYGHFNKLYEKFFGDYPDLCKQISEKKLKLEDIEDIVREYNVYKAEKSSKK